LVGWTIVLKSSKGTEDGMIWTLPFLLLVAKANTMQLLPEYSKLFLLQVLGCAYAGLLPRKNISNCFENVFFLNVYILSRSYLTHKLLTTMESYLGT